MLGPVALLALLATGATFYVIEIVVPDANQRFREQMFAGADEPRRRGGQAARLLRRIRQSDTLRQRDLPRRLVGRLSRGFPGPRPAGRLGGRVRPRRGRSRPAEGRRRPLQRDAPSIRRQRPHGLRAARVQRHPYQHRHGVRVPAEHAPAGPERAEAAGAAQRGGTHAGGRRVAAPADHGNARALLGADRLPRFRTGGRRPRDHHPQGRQVVELRASASA